MSKKQHKTGSPTRRQRERATKGRHRSGGPSSPTAPPDEPSSGGGGAMMRLRGGTQALVGGGKRKAKPKTALSQAFDVLLWIVTIGVIAFVLYARFVKR